MKNTLLLLGVILIALSVQSATFNVSNPSELQTALSTTESNGEDDIIILANGTYNITSTLNFYSTENYTLTIRGNTASNCIIDGSGSSRIIMLETTTSNGNINILNITFQNGHSTNGGVGINTESATTTISSCIFTSNTAIDFGGGLSAYTNNGAIIIDDCTFTNNIAIGNDAGGLFAGTYSGNITLSNSIFTGNIAQGDDAGGCMLYSDSTGIVVMHDNNFTNNSAEDDAGGAMVYLLADNSSATVYNNDFQNNNAHLGGGGCWIRLPGGGEISYYNNTHKHNTTDIGAGGGVLIELQINGNLDLFDNSFSFDTAGIQNGITSDGGAIWIEHGAGLINILRNDIFDCYAYNNGGGIFTYTETGTVNIHHNRIAKNSCGNVGGGFSFAGAICSLNSYNNSYYGNTAGASGGSEYLYLNNVGTTTAIYNNIYYGNKPDNFDYSGAITISISYSLVEGSSLESYFGTGCIDSNPLFTDTTNNNLLLSWSNYPVNDATKSPCIDTGDPTSPNDPDASRADMGAYYYGAGLSVNDNPNDFVFRLFPNPAKDYINIECNGPFEFCIYNIQGKKVIEETANNIIKLDVSRLHSGYYFLRIVSENRSSSSAFVIN